MYSFKRNIRKKIFKINDLSFQLKKVGKNQIKAKVSSREENSKQKGSNKEK